MVQKLFWLLLLISLIFYYEIKTKKKVHLCIICFFEQWRGTVRVLWQASLPSAFHWEPTIRWAFGAEQVSSVSFYLQLKTWKDCPNSFSISFHGSTENYSDDRNNFKAVRKKIFLNEQQLQENRYFFPSKYQVRIFPLLIVSHCNE